MRKLLITYLLIAALACAQSVSVFAEDEEPYTETSSESFFGENESEDTGTESVSYTETEEQSDTSETSSEEPQQENDQEEDTEDPSENTDTEAETSEGSGEDEKDKQDEEPAGEDPAGEDPEEKPADETEESSSEKQEDAETEDEESSEEKDPDNTDDKKPDETEDEESSEDEVKDDTKDKKPDDSDVKDTEDAEKESGSDKDKTEKSESEEEKKDSDSDKKSKTKKDKKKETKDKKTDEEKKEPVNPDAITPAAGSVWIETIPHPCNGFALSAEKYERFRGLTDFTFFTAQESGSYSAYNAGDGMVVLGKYQFTDFGTQGNGTATALVSFMQANCYGDAQYLYDALYQAFVIKKRTSVDEWNACALNDTENFIAMQDEFAYQHYYLRGEAAVEAAGISLKDRPWVVKGICFSIFNTLGPYDEYGSGAYAVTTAGISNDDSNEDFIRKVCDQMAALYAERYTWLYGRYADGTDTAMGVSDKDLALEILSGTLYEDKDAVAFHLNPIKVTKLQAVKPKADNFPAWSIKITGTVELKYANEKQRVNLKKNSDYSMTKKINSKHTKMTVIVTGKGEYEGQEVRKIILLPAEENSLLQEE